MDRLGWPTASPRAGLDCQPSALSDSALGPGGALGWTLFRRVSASLAQGFSTALWLEAGAGGDICGESLRRVWLPGDQLDLLGTDSRSGQERGSSARRPP